jgi:hypothetical protein
MLCAFHIARAPIAECAAKRSRIRAAIVALRSLRSPLMNIYEHMKYYISEQILFFFLPSGWRFRDHSDASEIEQCSTSPDRRATGAARVAIAVRIVNGLI